MEEDQDSTRSASTNWGCMCHMCHQCDSHWTEHECHSVNHALFNFVYIHLHINTQKQQSTPMPGGFPNFLYSGFCWKQNKWLGGFTTHTEREWSAWKSCVRRLTYLWVRINADLISSWLWRVLVALAVVVIPQIYVWASSYKVYACVRRDSSKHETSNDCSQEEKVAWKKVIHYPRILYTLLTHTHTHTHTDKYNHTQKQKQTITFGFVHTVVWIIAANFGVSMKKAHCNGCILLCFRVECIESYKPELAGKMAKMHFCYG